MLHTKQTFFGIYFISISTVPVYVDEIYSLNKLNPYFSRSNANKEFIQEH